MISKNFKVLQLLLFKKYFVHSGSVFPKNILAGFFQHDFKMKIMFKKNEITLLRVIPTMTFIHSIV